ncbi:MAG: ABC transporter permease [Chloroflexi bacterium]|nr:ABC transporter permease [Chloroflexota bacterium]
MLFRIIKETFVKRKKRVALAFLSVFLAATLVSALLTVYADITGKMSQELRSYGANILVRPGSESLELDIGGIVYTPPSARSLLDERELPKLKTIFWRNNIVGFAPFLSAVASVGGQPVILTGTWFEKTVSYQAAGTVAFKTSEGQKDLAVPSGPAGGRFVTGVKAISPWWELQGDWVGENDSGSAIVGAGVAGKLGLSLGKSFTVDYEGRSVELRASGIVTTGGFEDNQVFVNLPVVQGLLRAPYGVDRLLVSALVTPKDKIPESIRGKTPEQMTPKEYELWYCTPLLESIAYQVEEVLPGGRAAAIRQIAEAESAFLSRTQFLVLLITALALVASALAVMTVMTTLVMERRREIGLMKAIGAQDSQVAGIFFLEAGAIGLGGGLPGYLGGLGLAQVIGRAVFGLDFSFGIVALPLTVAVAVAVAVAGSILPVSQAIRVKPVQLLKEA